MAIWLAGCGGGDDRDADSREESARADPRTRALGRLPDGMSAEFIERLVAKLKSEYPPTGHDMWVLADDILAHGDNPPNAEFERRLRQRVLSALRVRAENIFAVVFVGRDPPGADELKFVITNRTGRKVAEVSGVVQVLSAFDAKVASLKAGFAKPIGVGGHAAITGHWQLPDGLVEQLAADDDRYQLKFVATSVTYIDGTVEKFP